MIAFLSAASWAPPLANSPSGWCARTRSLGTGSRLVVPTGWQKKAMLYLGSSPLSPSPFPVVPVVVVAPADDGGGNTTRCTVLRRRPLVQ